MLCLIQHAPPRFVRLLCVAWLVLLIATVAPAGEAPAAKDVERKWIDGPQIGHDQIKARVRVRATATAADEDWLRIEFHNSGAKTAVRNSWYSFRVISIRDIDANKPVPSRETGGGSFDSMFPKDQQFLPAGVHEITAHPSAITANCLGLPPEGAGWQVELDIKLGIEPANAPAIDLRRDPVRITFTWRRPGLKQMDQLRAAARDMLAHPSARSEELAKLEFLLRDRDMSSTITMHEALNGIPIRRASDLGRRSVVALVNRRWPTDEAVLAYYLKAISLGNREAASDIRTHHEIWGKQLIEPLVQMAERAAGTSRFPWDSLRNPLDFLAGHDADWANDARITARLSAAVRRAFEVLDETDPNKSEAGDWKAWGMATEFLALTRDRAMVAKLRPFLDVTAEVNDFIDPSINFRSIAPFRACDQAHDVILKILRRPKEELGMDHLKDETKPQQIKRRDAAIDKLRKELQASGAK